MDGPVGNSLLSMEIDFPDTRRSWHYLTSVDCLTSTNDEQPEITATYSRFLVDDSACICARSPACSENLFIGGLLKAAHLVTVLMADPPVRHTEFSLGTIGCF